MLCISTDINYVIILKSYEGPMNDIRRNRCIIQRDNV